MWLHLFPGWRFAYPGLQYKTPSGFGNRPYGSVRTSHGHSVSVSSFFVLRSSDAYLPRMPRILSFQGAKAPNSPLAGRSGPPERRSTPGDDDRSRARGTGGTRPFAALLGVPSDGGEAFAALFSVRHRAAKRSGRSVERRLFAAKTSPRFWGPQKSRRSLRHALSQCTCSARTLRRALGAFEGAGEASAALASTSSTRGGRAGLTNSRESRPSDGASRICAAANRGSCGRCRIKE